MKGRKIPYSTEELEWLEERADWPRRTLHSVFCVLFERGDLAIDDIKSLCTRKGWRTGRDGCFAKGSVPANKGKAHPSRGRSAETQFKKGRPVWQSRNYRPIGSERVTREGYIERKIHDGLPLQSRWRAVHMLRWEELNGPIPKSHCLKCLTGDTKNTEPSNWELIHRGVLARLNGGPHKARLVYDDAHPDLKPTLMAIAKVQHAASTASKRAST